VLQIFEGPKRRMLGRVRGNTGTAAGSSIIHFGFSIGDVQPVINVKGAALFVGKELIRKWSTQHS
jgi:hypothetical protein